MTTKGFPDCIEIEMEHPLLLPWPDDGDAEPLVPMGNVRNVLALCCGEEAAEFDHGDLVSLDEALHWLEKQWNLPALHLYAYFAAVKDSRSYQGEERCNWQLRAENALLKFILRSSQQRLLEEFDSPERH